MKKCACKNAALIQSPWKHAQFSRTWVGSNPNIELCHLKNSYITSLYLYETKQGGRIKYMRDKGNKNRAKDEDTKKKKPRSISVFRSFGTSTDEVPYSRKGMMLVVRETEGQGR